MLIASTLTFLHYRKTGYRYAFYMMLAWLFAALWCIGEGTAHLFLSPFIYRFGMYAMIIVGFSLILLVDHLSKESVDPIKVTILGAISAYIIFSSLDPNNITLFQFANKETGIILTGHFLYAQSSLNIFIGVLIIYYFGKIFINSPKNLKVYSGLFFFSAMLMGIVPMILIAIEFYLYIPAINALLVGISTLLITIILILQPKLAYILPFKAVKLTVIETTGGLPLFNYTWRTGEVLVDDDLFSGMIHGISQLFEETLHRGIIKEINLAQAVLILQREEETSVASILISTKSSKSLKNALVSFHKKFIEQFSQQLKIFGTGGDTSYFKNASELVLQCFPFIPEYE